MNKSKFLKKSLALLLAFMLVFAMIPLGASAAGSLTINEGGAYLFEAGGANGIQLTVDNEARTITGTYPLSRTEFKLDVLPSDDCSAVNYTADHVTNVPAQPMSKDANGRFSTPDLPKNGYLFQEDGKDYIKMTVQLAGDGTNAVNYFVTLEVTSNEVVSELTGLRVWTKNSYIPETQINGQNVQPQLGVTNVNQDKKTIDITVPYDTQYVWVRDFAPENASVSIGDVTNVGENTLVLGAASGAELLAAVNGGWAASDPSVKELPVVVTSRDGTSASTTNYTLRLTRASGFESFSLKDGTESKVFNKENKIVVVVPFGTKADGKYSTNYLDIIPEFDLTWENDEISYVKATIDQHTTPTTTGAEKITSGVTKIKVHTDNVTGSYDPYAAGKKKLSEANEIGETSIATDKITAQIVVRYVEGSERIYDLYVVEPTHNDQAVIHGLTIGTEEADVDEATRTINITLPYGTDVTKIPVSSVTIAASDNLKADGNGSNISVEYQTGVKFQKDDSSASKDGTVSVGDRTVKRNYVNNSSSSTLNGKTAILRVVSEDGKTTRDYTLKVTAAATRETPALETVTLQDPNGANYDGVLAADKHTFVFELPYKTQTIGDLNGWRLFWKKSVGSKVETANWPVSGAKIDTSSAASGVHKSLLLSTAYGAGDVADTTVIKATKNDYLKPDYKGIGIELSSSEAGINEQDKDTFYLMLTRKTPNAIAGLSKFSMASAFKANGSGAVASMSYDDVTSENTYAGKISESAKTIEIIFPASHFQLKRVGTNQSDYLRYSTFATGIEANAGNTVWYRLNGTGDFTLVDAVTATHTSTDDIPLKAQGANDLTGGTNAYYEILVLCEQTSIDIAKTNNGKTILAATWTDAIAAGSNLVPANGYKSYKMYAKADDAQKGGVMTALSLVDSRGRVADVALKVDTKNKIITGTVPYGMTTAADPTNKLFLKYTVSPMALLLSGTVTDPVLTPAGNIQDIATSTAGHFDNADIHGITGAAGAKALNCNYLPNGGAYVQVTPDSAHIKGDVSLFSASGTEDTTHKNQIVVVSEEYKDGDFTQKTEYTFDLNVAAARNDADIKTFSLNGFTGSISGNTINVTVSQGTDKTALIPTFTLSDGAYIKDDAIESGKTPLNFSTERLITVYAENGKTTKTYRVNVNTQEGFLDVSKDAWYYEAVMTAYNNQWIDGVRPGYFSPNGTMTRAQFAKFIANIDGFDANQWTEPVFPDVDPESWYGPAVAYCVDKGYIKGFEDNTFKPNNNITREQMAVVICEAKKLKPISGNTKFADDAKIGSWAKPYINACVAAGVISGKENNLYDPKANLKRCEGATVLVKAFGTSE